MSDEAGWKAIRCAVCSGILWLDPTGTGLDARVLDLRVARHKLRCPGVPPKNKTVA